MSAAPVRSSPRMAGGHIHLPSIHIRDVHQTGFDYEEDFYVRGRGRQKQVERVIRFAAVEHGHEQLVRETRDVLCSDDVANLAESLELLTETDLLGNPHPEAAEHMQQRARLEFERQMRIAAGEERACLACGCSETRACSGGCIWATPNLCSRCV